MNQPLPHENASISEISSRLRQIDMGTLDSAAYRALNRELKSIDGPPLRIAYLGNMTLDLLPSYIKANCAREGWLATSYVGDFAQYHQTLLSPDFKNFKADIVLLILSLRLLRPDAMSNFSSLPDSGRKALRNDVLAEIEAWVKQASAATQANLLITNFPMPAIPTLGIADYKDDYGEIEFYTELNLELLRCLRQYTRVHLLDINRLSATLGHTHAFDERLFHISKSDWSESLMAIVGKEVARHAVAAKGVARKCLVLDIDNTIWGGIVGEDGPMGIRIGHGDAESEAYLSFQQRIRTLKDRGILLALCSKNNPADVEEAFRLRPEMPLRLEDFSACSIGWEPKHQGLLDIASALNIGIDSIVFIDDNPAEIELIRDKLPMVESVLLPADHSAFVATLSALTSFEKTKVLADDIDKARQYAQEAKRSEFSGVYDNIEDYLAGLAMEVEISPVDSRHLQRVHQLYTKTNQFNVTTKRYSLGELESMLESQTHHLGMVSLRDRFGDLGIIATFILREFEPVLHIDSLLMSCRALGRGVETAIMNYIKDHLLEAEHLSVLTAEFIPTTRNKPAEKYFTSQGFQVDVTHAGEKEAYVLYKAEVENMDCNWIKTKGAQLCSSKSTLSEYS